MNRLYWDTIGYRMGWFLEFNPPNNPPSITIHGPSICVSSGGGPLRALEEVQRMGLEVHRIEIPEHDSWDGGPCDCQFLAQVYNSSARK